jgi:hypothetical protein
MLAGVLTAGAPAEGQLGGTGAFVIDKVVLGDTTLRGPVTIAVSCTNGREETITFDRGVTPTPQLVGGLAPGTICTVTEPVSGANKLRFGDHRGCAGGDRRRPVDHADRAGREHVHGGPRHLEDATGLCDGEQDDGRRLRPTR